MVFIGKFRALVKQRRQPKDKDITMAVWRTKTNKQQLKSSFLGKKKKLSKDTTSLLSESPVCNST